MQKTSIGWCTYSTNPIRARLSTATNNRSGHYCEKISEGCKHCYSSAMQPRLFGLPQFQEQRGLDGLEIFLERRFLTRVRQWKTPERIFWCDMTDMLGAWVPDAWIAECFATMQETPWHHHLILTKRPERFLTCLPPDWGRGYPNVGVGVSVENRRWLSRLEVLKQVSAAVRFVSIEPLLQYLGDLDDYLEALDWVIVGGESGPQRRPMAIHWLTSIVEQCQAAGIPTYVKQDTALRPGQQGRIADDIWTLKQLPRAHVPQKG